MSGFLETEERVSSFAIGTTRTLVANTPLSPFPATFSTTGSCTVLTTGEGVQADFHVSFRMLYLCNTDLSMILRRTTCMAEIFPVISIWKSE
jgi:hypothetical protein